MAWSRRSVLAASLGATVTAGCGLSVSGPTGAVVKGGCDLALTLSLQGFDPALLQKSLDAFAASPTNFHSLLIERHGRPVAEAYRTGSDSPLDKGATKTTAFDACALHDVRSISKSVTSLLWGIAAAEGKTPPLGTPALSLYPALKQFNTGGREAITLEHLLTMSSGLRWQEENYGSPFNDEFDLYWRNAQPKHLFNRPMAAPAGTVFNYNGGCTAVIADLLQRFVGMSLPAYAQEKLFAPLGISEWIWAQDYHDRPLAFAGLRLRPRDLLRIGRMMLNGGAWEGRAIVPADWIAASVRPHILAVDGLHYGYFWWLGETEALGATHPYVAGFGNGGQRLFLVPDLDVAVVVTAGEYNKPAGRLSNKLFHDVMATLRV